MDDLSKKINEKIRFISLKEENLAYKPPRRLQRKINVLLWKVIPSAIRNREISDRNRERVKNTIAAIPFLGGLTIFLAVLFIDLNPLLSAINENTTVPLNQLIYETYSSYLSIDPQVIPQLLRVSYIVLLFLYNEIWVIIFCLYLPYQFYRSTQNEEIWSVMKLLFDPVSNQDPETVKEKSFKPFIKNQQNKNRLV
ncbi:MAG: hypothetical protein ACXACR_17610, partial [Candidatus Hodarchaeales archaeon]